MCPLAEYNELTFNSEHMSILNEWPTYHKFWSIQLEWIPMQSTFEFKMYQYIQEWNNINWFVNWLLHDP